MARTVRADDLLDALERTVSTGHEPDGLCGDRGEHPAHLHDSASLGRFWCTADQSQREPGRSEARRRKCQKADGRPKTVFASAAQAEEAIGWNDHQMHVYRCDEHNGWHLGHSSTFRP